MTALATRRGRPRAFDRTGALRAAQRSIWEHGYEGMSLSQLEIVMGIGKTSLYAAFGSKLELLKEAADLYLSEAGTKLRGILDGNASTRDAISGFLAACAEDFTDPSRPPGCFLVIAAPACSEENAPAIAFLRERRMAVHALIVARLERGMAEGDLRAGASVDSLAEHIMTIVHGMSIQARDGSSRQALMQTARWAVLPLDQL
jgi:AcrR family transcriptional regulator